MRKRKHYGLSEEEAGSESIRSGQYIQANPILLTLTSAHEQLSDAARGLRFVHDSGINVADLRPVQKASLLLMKFDTVDRVTY